jgi:hypothetical protein
MSPARQANHRWARARLAASRLGLLGEADEARLRAHLVACEACREAAEPLEEEPGTAVEGHVPATLVARWDRARHELRGLERALVRRHLERCAGCREDLAAAGHAAELAVVPGLEWDAGEDLPDRRVAGEEREPAPRRLVLQPAAAAPWRRRDRLLAGWATLATAAALVLLVPVLRQPMPLQWPQDAPGTVSPPAVPAPPLSLTLDVAGAAHALRSPSRDGEAAAQVLRLGDSTVVVALAVPPVLAPAGSAATLELLDADGRALARAVCPLGRLQPGGAVLLRAGGAPVPPGAYVLRVTTAPDGGSALGEPEVREFRFRLER